MTAAKIERYLRWASLLFSCHQTLRERQRKISLKLSDAALDFLAEVGYYPVFGARPLKRAIQRELETQIAKAILRGEFNDRDTIFVDVQGGAFVFQSLAG